MRFGAPVVMDNVTTLIIHWVFSCAALAIMTVRLVWRRVEKYPFTRGDYLTMGAALCALVRLSLIHVVVIWGTSNMPPAVRAHHVFTPTEIYQRQVGSKFSLANRFFYDTYLWLQKLVLLDLYSSLIANLKYSEWVIRAYLFLLFATYVPVQVTIFSECKPVSLYWQIVPDPGDCVRAQVQLLTLGILNIITDGLLILLPLPVIAIVRAPWRRKVQLSILFTLGIFVILITAIRLPINSEHADSQVNRTTWAATELVACAIVVNAPALLGLWNVHKRKGKPRGAQNKNRGQEEGDFPDTIGGGSGGGGGGGRVFFPKKMKRRLTEGDEEEEEEDAVTTVDQVGMRDYGNWGEESRGRFEREAPPSSTSLSHLMAERSIVDS